MASTRLDRTNGSPTNGQKGTFSTWVRLDKVGAQKIMINYLNSENYSYIRFHPSKFLQCYATLSNSVVNNYKTERSFVDFNGWYHIVARIDTTQATATDRLRLYVNGELQTAYDTQTYSGSQNAQHPILIASATNTHRIGADENPADYFSGLMSHFHFCDGYSYDASAFGSTDATTGEWKINTSPSVTYGNNGYFILKDGNSVTDQSGNSNNFTVTGGTLTKTESSPSNVFATMNPLHYESRNTLFYDGNTTLVSTGSPGWTDKYGLSTLAMGSGKYYLEVKVENTGASSQSYPIGIIAVDKTITSSIHDNGVAAIRASNGNIVGNGSNIQTGLTAISAGDILGASFDATNGTIQFYRNGSTHGNAVTGIDTTKEYYFGCNTYDGSSQFKFNFGNGTFGSSGISDAGTNASNNGIFEYDVPTGYTALSTKGLNL